MFNGIQIFINLRGINSIFVTIMINRNMRDKVEKIKLFMGEIFI